MKKDTMLPPGPTAAEVRNFVRWYRIVLLLFLGVLVACVGSDIPTIMLWYHAYAERKYLQAQLTSFEQVLQEKYTLKSDEQELVKQLGKITAITSHSKWLFDYILAAQKALGDDSIVQFVSMKKKKFQISFESSDLNAVMAAVTRLQEKKDMFSSVFVTSISQKAQDKTICSATVHGLLV